MLQALFGGVPVEGTCIALEAIKSAVPSGDTCKPVQVTAVDVKPRLRTIGRSTSCILIVLSEDLVAQAGNVVDEIRDKLIVFTSKEQLLERLRNKFQLSNFMESGGTEQVESCQVLEGLDLSQAEPPQSIETESMDIFIDLPKVEDDIESLKSVISGKDGVIAQLQLNIKSMTTKNEEEVLECMSIIDDLKLKVSSYETKLLEAESNEDLKVATDEIERLKTSLQDATHSLKDAEEQLSILKDNIFTNIATKAIPRAAVVDFLPVDSCGNDVIVVASGSGDSLLSSAQVIAKLVESNSDERFIIIDIGNETFVDFALRCSPSKNPLRWLQGLASLDEVLCETGFENTKLSSLSITSFNEAYLLNVDWNERIKELSSYPATVILNIGCIGNLVKNHLFYSFSKVAQSYVVAKASPYNLRAVYMNMGIFLNLTNTTVVCVGYTENSKSVFTQLSSKYNCKLLESNEVLQL